MRPHSPRQACHTVRICTVCDRGSSVLLGCKAACWPALTSAVPSRLERSGSHQSTCGARPRVRLLPLKADCHTLPEGAACPKQRLGTRSSPRSLRSWRRGGGCLSAGGVGFQTDGRTEKHERGVVSPDADIWVCRQESRDLAPKLGALTEAGDPEGGCGEVGGQRVGWPCLLVVTLSAG